MSNMSYCRFENTYKDLMECLEALDNTGGVEGVESSANEDERPYVRRLIDLCNKIVESYQDE